MNTQNQPQPIKSLYHTENKQESIEYLNQFITEAGVRALTESELRDWGINGGESYAELEIFAKDYLSDIHTEICEAKNEWRYKV